MPNWVFSLALMLVALAERVFYRLGTQLEASSRHFYERARSLGGRTPVQPHLRILTFFLSRAHIQPSYPMYRLSLGMQIGSFRTVFCIVMVHVRGAVSAGLSPEAALYLPSGHDTHYPTPSNSEPTTLPPSLTQAHSPPLTLGNVFSAWLPFAAGGCLQPPPGSLLFQLPRLPA